jgi:hypothetical protein
MANVPISVPKRASGWCMSLFDGNVLCCAVAGVQWLRLRSGGHATDVVLHLPCP